MGKREKKMQSHSDGTSAPALFLCCQKDCSVRQLCNAVGGESVAYSQARLQPCVCMGVPHCLHKVLRDSEVTGVDK